MWRYVKFLQIWQNFTFYRIYCVEKAEIPLHVEKFQISPHLSCIEIWNFSTWLNFSPPIYRWSRWQIWGVLLARYFAICTVLGGLGNPQNIELDTLLHCIALCGYPLVKFPVETFGPLLPFSWVLIISDKIFGVCYLCSFTFKMYLGPRWLFTHSVFHSTAENNGRK